MKKKNLFTELDEDFTFKKRYLFFYSMKIEEDRIYNEKNPTLQESKKTKKKKLI